MTKKKSPKTLGQCTYCGTWTNAVEMEHVFPESWYPEPKPAPSIQPCVPSCPACNDRFARVEERVRRYVAAGIDPNAPAALGIWNVVKRSLDPNRARGSNDRIHRQRAKEKFFRELVLVPATEPRTFPGFGHKSPSLFRLPDGRIVWGSPATLLAQSDVDVFGEKLVRGLFRRERGVPLPPDVHVEVFCAKEEAWPEIAEQIQRFALSTRGVPPGFLYWCGFSRDDNAFSVWYFLIWGQLFLQGVSIPPSVEITNFSNINLTQES